MICMVWFLSALVSLPTLLYPPWRIPFVKPSGNNIHLVDEDRVYLNSVDGLKVLAHNKCSVSTFYDIIVLLSQLFRYYPDIRYSYTYLEILVVVNI